MPPSVAVRVVGEVVVPVGNENEVAAGMLPVKVPATDEYELKIDDRASGGTDEYMFP